MPQLKQIEAIEKLKQNSSSRKACDLLPQRFMNGEIAV